MSERVVTACMDTMDTVGTKGCGLATTVLNSGNGKVGGFLVSTLAWWINGISGGIHDGVGEGMALMGASDGRSEAVRGR